MDNPKSSSLSLSGGGLKRKSSCALFGDNYYSKISKLLLSTEEGALEELKECLRTVQAARTKPTDEFWDSGDEMMPMDNSMKTSIPKKTTTDKMRIMKLESVPDKKKKAGKLEPPSLPKKKSDVVEVIDMSSDRGSPPPSEAPPSVSNLVLDDSKSRSASPNPSLVINKDDKSKKADLSATFEAYKKKKERQMIRAGNLMKK